MENKKYEWVDSTTYGRDRPKVQTCWALKCENFSITITNGHLYNPGNFVMHCYALGFNTVDIKIAGDKVEDAKIKAIRICKKKAQEILNELKSINESLL